MKPIAHVGVDYHVKTVTIAVYCAEAKTFLETTRLPNNDSQIKKHMKRLSEQFELRICYEASGNGYAFARKMHALGYHCDIIAPSLIPKKSGDRRKNDHRDARNLAQSYANGQLTPVHLPDQQQESVRSLMRCRLALKESEKRVKQQINSFVLSRDCHWDKSRWTTQHRVWLTGLKFPNEFLHQVLQEFMGLLSYIESRLQSLDQQIEQLAHSETYASSVNRLRALKGIGTLTAMVLITEITDFRRFPSPRALMAFLGLIPGERSSDQNTPPVPITKTGNHRCRTLLIETVYHYVKKPGIGTKMKQAFALIDAQSACVATKCMHRLHKRYWALLMRGKIKQKALVAIARELVGFIWALMQPRCCAIA
jgi:transposase